MDHALSGQTRELTMKFMQRRAHRGFTLIEMMVVMVIIGIIAAIAYPSYTKHVVKGHRAAAQAHLLEIANAQSQYLADARTYGCTMEALTLTTPTTVSSKYTITIPTANCSATTFVAKATPITTGTQANDGELTINQSGAKTPAALW